jgi:hypothetical protein
MNGMKDMLFLEKGCAHCGSVLAVLKMEAVARDDFRTSEGNEFLVFVSMSHRATVELLGSFGQTGKAVPLLVKANGEAVEAPNQIIAYLRQSKAAAE